MCPVAAQRLMVAVVNPTATSWLWVMTPCWRPASAASRAVIAASELTTRVLVPEPPVLPIPPRPLGRSVLVSDRKSTPATA